MSLRYDDLKDLVSNKIHIDEYKSKMGDDADTIVVSFKVRYQDPAWELSNFFEKGYEWVLDADVSSGEMEDGSYLVFLEIERRPSFPPNLMRALKDMEGLTGQKVSEYKFMYRKSTEYKDMSMDNIKSSVPLSPREYRSVYGNEQDQEETAELAPITAEESKQLRALQSTAGITPKTLPITDPVLKHFVNLSKR